MALYEFLAILLQLVEGSHTDTGRWFLAAILSLLLIGGVLLLVRGLRDLRREDEARQIETTDEDRRKAA